MILALVSASPASLVSHKTPMIAPNVFPLNKSHPVDRNAQNSRLAMGLHAHLVPPLANPAPEALQMTVRPVPKGCLCLMECVSAPMAMASVRVQPCLRTTTSRPVIVVALNAHLAKFPTSAQRLSPTTFSVQNVYRGASSTMVHVSTLAPLERSPLRTIPASVRLPIISSHYL